jgi:hypothetical protein
MDLSAADAMLNAGFRFGDKGTHTSRTIMLAELTDLLAELPADSSRDDYAAAIIEDNILGKQTAATRRLTKQRLKELYGLDRQIPVFRVLRRLWNLDPDGRPLIALMCALARDPLLRATAPAVIALPAGSELVRGMYRESIRQVVGDRLNESILDKVARNSGSSWTQSGHLEGRVRKIRRRVSPTPAVVAMAVWLGSLEGLAGIGLLESRWVQILDLEGEQSAEPVLQAKQRGLINARIGGGVVEIDTRPLDSASWEV